MQTIDDCRVIQTPIETQGSNPGVFEIKRCIDESFAAAAAAYTAKSVEPVLLIDPEVPDTLFGDGRSLRLALEALLHNAYRFTSAGEVRLSVGLKSRVESACELSFSIQDTGAGISGA